MSLRDKSNYWRMQSFNLKNIPNLDECVLGALEFFNKKKLPKINILDKGKILVVGSGNALVAGKIIFEKYDAVFVDESSYEKVLSKYKIKTAVLISASGGKHAPIIARKLKSRKIKTILFTTNKDAQASKFVSKTIVFEKQREPYTYNTSTYLSMILSSTKEEPKKIYSHIKKIEKLIPKRLSKYNSIYIIVPAKFNSSREMFQTKFDELFGPKLNGRVFTMEQTKHAKTVVSSKKELFISLGEKNEIFGTNRLHIPLTKTAKAGEVIATGYFVIGKIQKSKSSYFKKNIAKYCMEATKIFGSKISPIVG